MACYPGTPCNPVPVSAVYPKKCNNGWFAGYPIQTNLICYNGPNLPNTGVNTGNNMNLVLEKIDLYLTPETLVQTLLQTIQSNPSLNVSFCTLVNACVENTTTTTTTSSSTTTTTTTTAAPTTTTTTTTVGPYVYFMKYSAVSGAAACSDPTTVVILSDSPTLDLGVGLWINSSLTTYAAPGFYCIADGCPNAYNIQYVEFVGTGIANITNC
jgi:hypothetical protein